MSNSAEVQQQEIATLLRELRGAKARRRALEDAASMPEGDCTAVQLAGRIGPEQLDAQTEIAAAMKNKVSGLQDCVVRRDAEITKLHEQLYGVQRELDQAKRESAAKVKVRHAPFLLVQIAVLMYCFSVCVRAGFVSFALMRSPTNLWNRSLFTAGLNRSSSKWSVLFALTRPLHIGAY